jgi:hypothetical protein
MTPKANNSKLLVGIVVLIFMVLVLLVIIFQQKRYNWSETYNPTSSEPYGTVIFNRLMKNVRNQQEFVMVKDSAFKELPKDPSAEVDNYIYIGSEFYANLNDTKQIFDFVAAGNNAYIFCDNPRNLIADSILVLPELPEWEEEVLEYVYDEESDYEDYEEPQQESIMQRKFYTIYDSLIDLHFYNHILKAQPPYGLSYYFHFERVGKSWSFFNDSLKTRNGDENYSNFISCQYGKGQFYFHSTPLVFTNYYMLNDTAMNYCRNTLKSMGNGKVYWDEDNRDYDLINFNLNDEANDPTKPHEGPMEFILSEPTLRYAWYTLLVAGLLYLFFGAKRKQRIIPAMESMQNTSVEYTEVISQMFMNQSDHKKLVSMKMDIYKAYLRDTFNLKLPLSQEQENDTLYAQIAQKCSVNMNLVKDIFEQHKYLSALVEVDTAEMLTFHYQLEKFYETCNKNYKNDE